MASIAELKAQRAEASNKAKITKCAVQHNILRNRVIELTRMIKEASA